jgi:hypothetical protein
MKINKSMKAILQLAAFAVVTTSANAAVMLTLSNAGGGATWDASSHHLPEALLNDAFAYNADSPTSTSPNHAYVYQGTHNYLTKNEDAENYWFAQVTTGGNSLDSLDIWGNDFATHEATISRAQDLVISFYTTTDATGPTIATSAPFDGVSWNGDNANPTHGRFDVTSLISDAATRATIQSLRIDHSSGNTDYLELYEVRAAGSAVPEPTTTALLGLGGLALIFRRRK